MSRNDEAAEALVGAILTALVVLAIAVVAHYFKRAYDFWRLCTDAPEIYPLTDGERTFFLVSAWAFPVETSLLFVGSLVLAVTVAAGFAVAALIFGAVLAFSCALSFSNEGKTEAAFPAGGEFYDDFWD